MRTYAEALRAQKGTVLAIYDSDTDCVTRYEGTKRTHGAQLEVNDTLIWREAIQAFRRNPPASMEIGSC